MLGSTAAPMEVLHDRAFFTAETEERVVAAAKVLVRDLEVVGLRSSSFSSKVSRSSSWVLVIGERPSSISAAKS